MGSNCLSILKLQRLQLFHPTYYNGCSYLPGLALKLIRVSKGAPGWFVSCEYEYAYLHTVFKVGWYMIFNDKSLFITGSRIDIFTDQKSNTT